MISIRIGVQNRSTPTIQYVHPDRGRIGVRGFASVQPGIAGYRLLHQQSARGQDAFLRHEGNAAPGRIEIYVLERKGERDRDKVEKVYRIVGIHLHSLHLHPGCVSRSLLAVAPGRT